MARVTAASRSPDSKFSIPRWQWISADSPLAVSMSVAKFIIYALSTQPGAPPFWEVPDRTSGYGMLFGLGVFLSPWIALGALDYLVKPLEQARPQRNRADPPEGPDRGATREPQLPAPFAADVTMPGFRMCSPWERQFT